MEFKASMGKSIKIITIAIAVLFTVIIVGIFASGVGNSAPAAIIVPAILLLTFGMSYYFSIKSYIVTDDKVIIRRPFDTISYTKKSIRSAERIDRNSLRFSLRTFGIGGLFSNTGQFWNKQYGNMTWFVTRTDNAVMLITDTKKVVLSPDEPEEFIAALKM